MVSVFSWFSGFREKDTLGINGVAVIGSISYVVIYTTELLKDKPYFLIFFSKTTSVSAY